MDKKIFNKSSNFFKKEGFYVILFVCLCVVATVAAITTKNNRVAKEPIKKQVAQGDSKVIDDKSQPDNALQVKKPTVETTKTPAEAQKAADKTKAVSTTNNNSWVKPANGTVIERFRPLTETAAGRYETSTRVVFECKKDADVIATFDGKVVKVEPDEYGGVQVTVDHKNGYQTVYANLQDKSVVAQDKELHKGDKIGKVNSDVKGSTKANCLYFKLLDKSQKNYAGYYTEVNPARFIKY